jgi:Putative Actinobacterial Holin-X, holin superfamily III
MVILQAIATLLTRSLGKIFSALFGWAVNALFGQTSSRERTIYSVLVGAAAAWPLLVLGTAAPRVAALVLAFVPLSKKVDATFIRLVWIALALSVPLFVGLAFSRRAASPEARRQSRLVRLMRGFPITLGVAGAFLVVLVVTPIRKLTALVKGLADEEVPLVLKSNAYHEVAGTVRGVLDDHGFALERARAGIGKRLPAQILRGLGGDAFRAFIPDEIEHFVSPVAEVTVNMNGVTIRGEPKVTARAHGLVSEAMSRADVYQTTDPDAQAVEREIQGVWKVLDANPVAHTGSLALSSRVKEIAEEIVDLDAPYDDWQIVYREALQLARALHGDAQLLEKNAPKEVPMVDARPTAPSRTDSGERLEALPLAELLSSISDKAKLLVQKEVELAKTEVRADLKSEIGMAKSLAIGGVALMLGVQMLLVSLAFVLASSMEGWLAALVVGGPFLLLGIAALVTGWAKRVQKPLESTRESVKENLEWAKNRLA